MAVTHKWYGPGIKNIFNGNIGALNSTATNIKVALMSSAHAFNQAHETFSQVSTNEISTATNDYTSGGESLANKSLAYSSRVTKFDADNVIFTSTGSITAYHGVIYHNATAGSTASYLISSINFGGKQEAVSGTFALNWSTAGILTNTVAI